MSVSLYEQETTISFRRVDDFATVWTSDTTVMTKLDRMCRESPENYKCTETGVASLEENFSVNRTRSKTKA